MRIPSLAEGLFPKKTSMVEFLDGIDNGACGDIYMENMDIFDFPMESLEADDALDEGDWDAKLQVLGPIPTEALLDPLKISGRNNGNAISECGGLSDIKLPPSFVKETSRVSTHLRKFQTPSPVSVLERGSSCSVEKSFFRRSGVPMRTRTKRSRSSTINPWLRMVPFISSTPKGSLHSVSYEELSGSNDFSVSDLPSKMANPVERRVKKKRKLSQLSNYNEMEANSSQHSVGTKRCSHCQATSTPQWREGPMGPKTLCNACGVRFRSGRLLPEYRPVASPTFVPSVHSNSHKRVVEMRFFKAIRKAKVPEGEPPMAPPQKAIHEAAVAEAEPLVEPHKAIQEAAIAEIELPPTSPPPEFVPMSSYLFDCVLGSSVQYF